MISAAVVGLWLGAYLAASIPFGLIVARAKGVDVRAVGSGNIGATNVGRALGRPWGILVLLLDAAKGFVPMIAARAATDRWPDSVPDWGPAAANLVLLGTGLACGIGAVAPVFAGFRGGKAVAASLGIVLGVSELRVPALAALAVFVLVRGASGYVSLGSIVAAAALPAAFLIRLTLRGPALAEGYPLLILCVGLAGLVVARHRDNIARLRRGTEGASAPGPNTIPPPGAR